MASPPNIVVIAGPNGSGKSTAAPWLLRDYLAVTEFVNADTIARGLSAFNAEGAAFQAGRIMLERMRRLAEARVDFAFETTLAAHTFAPWLDRLRRDKGYRVYLLFIWLPAPEMAIARVATRVQQGGHHVPDEVVRRRYDRGLSNFFHIYRPIIDEWMMVDTTEHGRPQLIAAQTDDQLPDIAQPESWEEIQRWHR